MGFFAHAQIQVPATSVAEQSSIQIGLTNFEINYSRPSVKGRQIFGELLPYNKVWRTGANTATLIRFDKKVKIGEQELAPGLYSLFSIPNEQKWTFIFNQDTTLWGAYGYDESKDVLRHEVKTKHLQDRVETMEFRWMNITDTSVKLTLEWENVRASLPIHVFTDEQVATQVTAQLNDEAKGRDYYQAAYYYWRNNIDLNQAYEWMNKYVAMSEGKYWTLRKKALLEKDLGKHKEAENSMQMSLDLATKSKDEHYIDMNTKSLASWQIDTLKMSANSVLDKSIAYHDPNGRWAKDLHEIKLYEGRPGGGYRITDLRFSEADEFFSLSQIKEQHLLEQTLDKGVASYKVDGKRELTEAQMKKHRFSPERTAIIRNYYAYLWGLPMKLKDTGTILGETVRKVDFFGERLIEIKVTYEQTVGGDIWYVYFDPNTYAMRGYRFYHDESANDGEYILIEGEAQVGQMKLPAKRHWYTHKDKLYLGSDEILSR